MNEVKDRFPKVLIIILLLFVSLSVSSRAVAGEIYKWKDKDGNVFFSDTPPPASVNAEAIPLKDERPSNFETAPKVNSPRARAESQKRRGRTAASRSSCI